jgi:putative addiction module component (TIGR02574 family)
MTSRAKGLLQSALSLSSRDRLSIVRHLYDSLEQKSPINDLTESEFLDELRRRDRELTTDASAGVSWDIVRRKDWRPDR